MSEPALKPDEGKKIAPNAAAPRRPHPDAPAAAAAPPRGGHRGGVQQFVLEGVPSGRQAADSNTLSPHPPRSAT